MRHSVSYETRTTKEAEVAHNNAGQTIRLMTQSKRVVSQVQQNVLWMRVRLCSRQGASQFLGQSIAMSKVATNSPLETITATYDSSPHCRSKTVETVQCTLFTSRVAKTEMSESREWSRHDRRRLREPTTGPLRTPEGNCQAK